MTKFEATLYYYNANIISQIEDPSISEDLHDDRINSQASTTRNKDGYTKWHAISLKHQQGKI